MAARRSGAVFTCVPLRPASPGPAECGLRAWRFVSSGKFCACHGSFLFPLPPGSVSFGRRTRPIRTWLPFLLPGLEHWSSVTRKFQSGRDQRQGARGDRHGPSCQLSPSPPGTLGDWAGATRQNAHLRPDHFPGSRPGPRS